MDGTIAIKDLAFFTLFILIAVVCVYLIIVLYNASKLLKQVNQVVAANRSNIDKTMAVIPETASNLNDAAVSIKETVDRAGNVLGTVDDTVSQAAASFEDTTENIFDIVKIIISTAKSIIALFSKE